MRVSIHDPAGAEAERHPLQAMEIFGEEIGGVLADLRRSGTMPRAMEIAKLARLPDYAKDIDVVFALYRAAGYMILHYEADVVFNAVRSHHLPMYRRFGFTQLTAPRSYPGLAFSTSLMACFRSNYAAARHGLPFLNGISVHDTAYADLIAGRRADLSASPEDDAMMPHAA